MKRRAVQLITLVLLLLALVPLARGVQTHRIMQSPVCQSLFRVEQAQGDSLPPDPHVPPEAEGAVGEYHVPDAEAEVLELYSPQCQPDLDVLPTELIEEAPGTAGSSALLSPSGRLITLAATHGDDSHIDILDLETGARWQASNQAHLLLHWVSETTLVLVESSQLRSRIFQLDVQTGDRTPLETYWEYLGPVPEVLVGPLYTGWQAASILEVGQEAICRAVHEGQFRTVVAADGTSLLTREDLLQQGPEVVRREHAAVLSPQEIIEMKNSARDVRAVRSRWRGAPIQQVDWRYALIMHGLPRRPHDVIVTVTDERTLGDIPLIENQLEIYNSGRPSWLDAHSEFFVAPNSCDAVEGYQYVLYRKGGENSDAVPLGILPYPVELLTRAVWSPDRQYIYIIQSAFGRYSVSRVRLPEF